MRRYFSSGTSGRNSRSSCGPECTKRKPTWENCALPPDSWGGAFSRRTTEPAPACLAEIAASSAALPPPMTMTSQLVFELMSGRCAIFESAVGEILIAQFRSRVGQRALRHPEMHAHFGEPDADRLRVEHLRAGRLGEVIGVDHVRDQRAAERKDDLRAGLLDQRSDEPGRDLEDFVLAL